MQTTCPFQPLPVVIAGKSSATHGRQVGTGGGGKYRESGETRGPPRNCPVGQRGRPGPPSGSRSRNGKSVSYGKSGRSHDAPGRRSPAPESRMPCQPPGDGLLARQLGTCSCSRPTRCQRRPPRAPPEGPTQGRGHRQMKRPWISPFVAAAMRACPPDRRGRRRPPDGRRRGSCGDAWEGTGLRSPRRVRGGQDDDGRRAGRAFCLAWVKSTLKCSTVLISNLRFDNCCFPTFVFMGC